MSFPNRRGDARGGAPEWRALLDLTHPEPRAPATAVDWSHLIDGAVHHKSILLLARGVERTGIAIPPDARDRLASLRAQHAARALRLASETARVAGALLAAGIPVLPVKGAPLSLALYGDVALRGPGDIDILIPPARLTDAAEVLRVLGYDPGDPGLLRSPRARARTLRFCKDLTFLNPALEISVECHWRLHIEPGTMRLDAHRHSGGAPVTLGGVTMNTLPPAETFVYLCCHGAKHLWHRLKWLNDIRWSLLDPRLAVDDLVEAAAAALRMTRVVASSVLLVRHVDGFDPPPALRGLIDKAPGAARDAARFIALLEANSALTQDETPPLVERQRRRLLAMTASTRDNAGVRGVLPEFFRPGIRDLLAVDLPSGMDGVYVLSRFCRVARRGLPGARR